MAGFWKSLTGGASAKKKTGETPPAIDGMSFEQIAAVLGNIDGRTAAKFGGMLTKRLYQIALYDNHVPEVHREGARESLRIIKRTMELAYSHSPDALAKYREANAFLEEGARRVGVGSLSWLLMEHNISDVAEMIEFVARADHRHLLEDFYAATGPDIAEQIKAKLAERT